MAKNFDINERMKVFQGLDRLSKENLEKNLKAIQLAQETNENTEINEELKELKEYLESHATKTVANVAGKRTVISVTARKDKEEYQGKEARYKELYSIMKSRRSNNSQEAVSPDIKEAAKKMSGVSKEKLEEVALLIRVCIKVGPELEKANKIITENTNEFNRRKKEIYAKLDKAKKVNGEIEALDKEILAKVSGLGNAQTEEEKEKMIEEYEALLAKRKDMKHMPLTQYKKDLDNVRDEYIHSETLSKAYKTIEFLTDKSNFEAIDKMSEEELRTAIENGTFIQNGQDQGQRQGQDQGQGQEQGQGQDQGQGQGQGQEPEPEPEPEPEQEQEPEQEPENKDKKALIIANLKEKHPMLAKNKFLLNIAIRREEKKLERKEREDKFVKGFTEAYGNEPSKFKKFLARHPRMRAIAKSFSRYKEAYDEIKMFSEKDYSENESSENAETSPKAEQPVAETTEQPTPKAEKDKTSREKHEEFAEQLQPKKNETDEQGKDQKYEVPTPGNSQPINASKSAEHSRNDGEEIGG